MKKNMGTMRRSSKGRRSTRRGGAAGMPNLPPSPKAVNSKEACVALLRKLLPEEYDFKRMQGYDYANVQGKTYKQFIQANVSAVYAMPEEECAFHLELFTRISKDKFRTMDMENASSMSADNVFFDAKGRLVLVSPR